MNNANNMEQNIQLKYVGNNSICILFSHKIVSYGDGSQDFAGVKRRNRERKRERQRNK